MEEDINTKEAFSSSPPEEFYPYKENNSSGNIIKVVVGIVILFFIGIGVVLGARIWDPVWSPFRPKPEAVLSQMFEKMKDIRSGHSDLKLTLAKTGTKAFQLSINGSSDSENKNLEEFKTKANFNFSLSSDDFGKMVIGGEVIKLKDDSYFKIDKLELPGTIEAELSIFGFNFDKIKGKWIKEPVSDLSETSSGSSKDKTDKKEEALEKIKELVKEYKFYVIKQKPDEAINGEKSYHYLFFLNKKETLRLLNDLNVRLKKYIEKDQSSYLSLLEPGSVDKATDSIADFIKQNGDLISFDVWIGKKDLLLRKLLADKEFPASVFSEKNDGNIKFVYDLEMSNFNRPMNIEAPKKVYDMEELMSSLGGGSTLGPGTYYYGGQDSEFVPPKPYESEGYPW
ncbi:MAG TPA: hypothetical protein ENL27_02095 [Candidatus Parcubacteria bacterium]|nr:hypothetical protein [Candidatus Parcubacteria bacterium]